MTLNNMSITTDKLSKKIEQLNSYIGGDLFSIKIRANIQKCYKTTPIEENAEKH